MRAFFVMGFARPGVGFDEPELTEGGPDCLGEGGLSRKKNARHLFGKGPRVDFSFRLWSWPL